MTDYPEELSEYELKRLERIAKNEAYLESIGLGNAKQKLKDMCQKTQKNARRAVIKKVKPGRKRRSKRLSIQKEKEHVMLSYYDDNELAIVHQDQQQELIVGDEESSPVRSRSRRYSSINRADFELSNEEKEALERTIDDNYLYKFKEFLVFHNKISEQNARNVMRQVSKLARGEGIRYESAKYGWAEGCYFMKGQQVTPMSDIVQLMKEGQECEDKWGRDRGNGWLLSHPLKKLLLFQQFCLNNPDFLTAKCKLSQYYALANDDCEMDIPEEASEFKEDSVSNPSTNANIAKQEEEKEEPESEVGKKNTRQGRQKVANKSQSNATKHAENSREPETTTNKSQRKQKRRRVQ